MWFPCLVFTLVLRAISTSDEVVTNKEPLLVAYNNDILLLGPNTSSVVVSSDSPVKAFDIHVYWRQVFWATDSFIYRTPLYDLKTTSVVAVVEEVAVGGLALDWIHHLVYWSDVAAGRVEVAHLDGKRRRIVYRTNQTLGALALDPLVGKLFWIESSHHKGQTLTVLKSSDTAGTLVVTLIPHNTPQPSGPLAVDPKYWTLYLYRANTSGSEYTELRYGAQRVLKLFDQLEGPPRSLTLSEQGFYYSNRSGLFLGRWHRKSYSVISGNVTASFLVLEPYFTTVDEHLADAAQLRVLHHTTQPRSQDRRGDYRCQHESTGPQAYECVCHYGSYLRGDLKSCLDTGYILYSTSDTFGRITMEGKDHMTLSNDLEENIQVFDVHIGDGLLFWADFSSQTIYRASVDSPFRRTAIVQKVSVYGVAVDWVHNHLYWTDSSSMMISSVDGTNRMVLMNNLDSPEDVAVDPLNRYIFWTECGSSHSLKRAGLVGDDVTTLNDQVSCGSTIVLDPRSQVIYWLSWMGSILTCNYSGQGYKEIFVDLASAIALVGGRLLVFPIERSRNVSPDDEHLLTVYTDIKPNAIRIVKASQQPTALNSCLEVECDGLCLPSGNTTVPLCLCPGENLAPRACSSKNKTKTSKGLVQLVCYTPFSVTLECSGPLLRHSSVQPSMQITEVDSLVNRTGVPREPWFVRVADVHKPFTIDTLNPATTYSVMLRNRVTRAAFSLTVHTPPPPLRVDRLPLISLPGTTPPPYWLPQGIHYFDPNPWQDLLPREYFLLLVSKKEYLMSKTYNMDETTARLIGDEIKDHYVVVKHYKTKEEFDDDPSMHLGNIPWGEEFRLAMVQMTQYRGAQHMDFVFSKTFELPDPSWINFMEDILENYKDYEVKN